MIVWYVIQVKGGGEARACQLIERLVEGGLYEECAVPRVETMHKYHGEWRRRNDVLFPGYIFVNTKDVQEVAVRLHDVPAFTRLLGSDTGFIPLTDQEVQLIRGLVNGDSQLMGMSEGLMEGDKIKIVSGPLKDYAGSIMKIDRHKKIAYLEFDMFGSTMHIKAGLDIVSKQA